MPTNEKETPHIQGLIKTMNNTEWPAILAYGRVFDDGANCFSIVYTYLNIKKKQNESKIIEKTHTNKRL